MEGGIWKTGDGSVRDGGRREGGEDPEKARRGKMGGGGKEEREREQGELKGANEIWGQLGALRVIYREGQRKRGGTASAFPLPFSPPSPHRKDGVHSRQISTNTSPPPYLPTLPSSLTYLDIATAPDSRTVWLATVIFSPLFHFTTPCAGTVHLPNLSSSSPYLFHL